MNTPTYGLVVCGGQSSRMGTDKSLLNYHGKPQRYYLYEMLEPLCEKVFISCNRSQKSSIPATYHTIVDAPAYEGIGPMAALLTAMERYPHVNFLVVGCDYPFITTTELKQLLEVKLETILYACFANKSNNILEPLLSHYHYDIINHLREQFKQNRFSVQAVLRECTGHIIVPENQITISSIDTIEAYENAIKQLHNK